MKRLFFIFIALTASLIVQAQSYTYRYWFDNNYSSVHTGSGTGEILLDIDASSLSYSRLHALRMQVKKGDVWSPVETRFFMLTDYSGQRMTVKLWIDDNESAAQVLPYTDEDIEIDISSLDYGTHQVTACLYDGSGVIIGRETVSFEYVFTGDIITMGKAKTTYCSDKPLDFGSVSGIDAFVASGFNPQTGTILLMRVKEVPAHTGLLLRGTAGQTYKIPYKETSFYYLNMFKGVLVRTDVPTTSDGYNNYILKDGLFYLSDGTAFVNPNKAYLQMPILSSKTRGIIGYTFDDGTTDVNEAITEDIDNDTNLYNLNGQKIDNPKKGIYIKNGKKIIIH